MGQASYQCLVLFLIIYGAPQHIPGYSLPTACPTYSAVDAHGVDISLLNATGGAVAYNPTVPAPYATYSEQKARCWRGPCVNLCCHTDSQGHCTDNLVSDGGHYLPSKATLSDRFDTDSHWSWLEKLIWSLLVNAGKYSAYLSNSAH